MKTRSIIEKLKADWLSDPCYDIYECEGFEDHREELEKFQAFHEQKWKDRRNEELKEKGKLMGTKNLKLVRYVESLESRIDRLENRIENHIGI